MSGLSNKLPIITADERLSSNRGIKGCILGAYGVGKTSLLWTLPPESTLFIDLEAGDLAVQGWSGDTLRPRSWQECRDFAVYLGGANLSVKVGGTYGAIHYEETCRKFGNPESMLAKYDTIFIDSITVAGRLCLQWCKNQPQIISDKTGREDTRAAYGLHGQEMITWLTHLQHIRNKNVWFVGILEEKTDDYNRKSFGMQIDGSKTANELPGIVDQVITLAQVHIPIPTQSRINSHDTTSSSEGFRAFVCHTLNPYGYPAKDRSGKLDMLEPPHLGKLMEKIKAVGAPIHAMLNHQMPKISEVVSPEASKVVTTTAIQPKMSLQNTALPQITTTENQQQIKQGELS